MFDGVRIKQSARGNGFTLIELLVVIVIIAILAAILFPVFQTAREKARQSTCASNEKQISVALLQYVEDFDDTPPSGSNDYYGTGWMGQVYAYIKSKPVFHCPDDLGRPGVTATSAQIYPSYRYNSNMVKSSNLSSDIATAQDQTLSSYSSPARTVMVYETSSQAIDPSAPNEAYSPAGNGESDVVIGSYTIAYPTLTGNTGINCYLAPPEAWLSPLPSPMIRHSNGSNLICADGHVKWSTDTMVSFGFTAAKSTNAASYNGGAAALLAEGADYNGVGAHALTMSIK